MLRLNRLLPCLLTSAAVACADPSSPSLTRLLPLEANTSNFYGQHTPYTIKLTGATFGEFGEFFNTPTRSLAGVAVQDVRLRVPHNDCTYTPGVGWSCTQGHTTDEISVVWRYGSPILSTGGPITPMNGGWVAAFGIDSTVYWKGLGPAIEATLGSEVEATPESEYTEIVFEAWPSGNAPPGYCFVFDHWEVTPQGGGPTNYSQNPLFIPAQSVDVNGVFVRLYGC